MSQVSKKRVVLVGCGGMSNVWLKASAQLPEIEIVGLVDLVLSAARQKAADYHLTQAIIGSDFQDVLEQSRPEIVFNCTIPEAHYAVTMQALASGCHILSEKPLASSLEQAQAMVTAARQAEKLLVVIQNRRYDLAIRRMAQFLASGALGPLTTVNSDFYVGAHFGGFREQMQHVLLLDMAIHSFDAARLLTQADPVSVYCQEWNPPGSWYKHDASAVAFFEMSNGLVYTYRGSWCAEGLPTNWACDWRFIGQQGSAIWDGRDNAQIQTVQQTGSFLSGYQDVALPNYTGTNVDGHLSILREFCQCIDQGQEPETRAADNLKSLAMVFAAIESAETGRKVSIRW